MNQAVNAAGAATGHEAADAERISAALDGESASDDLDAVLADLRAHGPDSRWNEYHLIGDLLRSAELHPVRAGFSASVMDRLEAEPTVLAPAARATRRGVWVRWGLPGASVAAAAALIWVAVPRIAGTAGEPAVINAAAAGTSAQAQAVAVAQEAPLDSTGVDRYLIAHQQVSPSANRHGIAPMTRAVSYPVSQR
jgi:sigma-E factor negative regulatory protein RseA